MINSSNLFYFETKNRSTPVRRARAKNTSIYIYKMCSHSTAYPLEWKRELFSITEPKYVWSMNNKT